MATDDAREGDDLIGYLAYELDRIGCRCDEIGVRVDEELAAAFRHPAGRAVLARALGLVERPEPLPLPMTDETLDRAAKHPSRMAAWILRSIITELQRWRASAERTGDEGEH